MPFLGFYAALLTDKQMNYIELYYADDCSLAEIAEEFSVSRQAVYDNIQAYWEDSRSLRMKLLFQITSSVAKFLMILWKIPRR